MISTAFVVVCRSLPRFPFIPLWHQNFGALNGRASSGNSSLSKWAQTNKVSVTGSSQEHVPFLSIAVVLCAAYCAAKNEQKIWLGHCNVKEQLLVPKAATGEKPMSWPATLGYYLKADCWNTGLILWDSLIHIHIFVFTDGVSSGTTLPPSLWPRQILQAAEVVQVSCGHSSLQLVLWSNCISKLIYYLLLAVIELRAFLATPTSKLEID